MKVILLAAGYATRLYPLTENMPKALLPIGGKPMLNYLMDEIATLKMVDHVHIVTNHRFVEQFAQWVRENSAVYPALCFTVWDDMTTTNENRLGAVGDIQFVIEHAHIDDDIMVAASDNFFTFALADFVADFMRHGKDTLLATHMQNSADLTRMAIAELDETGRVTGLVEKPAAPRTDIAVFAVYLYRQDTVPLFKKYLDTGNNPDAPGHFPEWLYSRKEVRAYLFRGECVDIGTVDSYRAVCKKYERSSKQ